MKSKTRQSTER